MQPKSYKLASQLTYSVDAFKGQPDFLLQFLWHLPYYTLLLDVNRRIVVSNNRFLNDHDLLEAKELFGMGPGDVFQCENAEAGGCGNSSNCQFCGIYRTISECTKNNAVVSSSCKLMINRDSFIKAYEFNVRCSPIKMTDDNYYILTLTDISAENRKINLENIFFHDVLNMVNGLKGFLLIRDNFQSHSDIEEYFAILSKISDRLSETITTQRDLMYAEKRELIVNMRQVSANEIIDSVIESSIFSGNNNVQQLKIERGNLNFQLNTDPILLMRVLVNMVKNALEARNSLSDITLGYSNADGRAFFYVHNHAFIEEEQAKSIFQPMCSTKGNNRGLGTYSMRLIGENYLKGKVGFKTHPCKGTTFSIELSINLF